MQSSTTGLDHGARGMLVFVLSWGAWPVSSIFFLVLRVLEGEVVWLQR